MCNICTATTILSVIAYCVLTSAICAKFILEFDNVYQYNIWAETLRVSMKEVSSVPLC
jgi:flagellar biosynthesis protein FlhB